MPIKPSFDRVFASVFRKVPLRVFLTVPSLVSIVVVAGLTGWLSWQYGQQTVNQLAYKLQDEIAERIRLKLEAYLTAPKLIARINADEARLNQLPLAKLPVVERHLFTQLMQFDSVSSILLGTPDGHMRSVSRRGQLRLLKSDPADGGQIYDYALDSDGKKISLLQTFSKPEVQKSAWYRSAVSAGGPVWGSIFQTPDNQDLSLNVNIPIYNEKSGELLGVASCGVVLSVIDRFLDNLRVSQSGLVFIMERDGQLVGASTSQLPYTIEQQNGRTTVRQIHASDSSNPLIQSTIRHLTSRLGGFNEITHLQQLTFTRNGEREFVKVMPFRDELGLDWLIVVVIPQSDFMEQINANTRTTIWLCAAAAVVTLLLGLVVSNWVAKPMRRLSQASHDMAEGDLAQRIPDEIPIREMQVTSQAFNQMAQQLRTSFEQIELAKANLEAQVQDRTAQLRNAVSELERLNHLKDDFLSTVSHELRTPMSNIKMATQMLEISLKRLGVLDADSDAVLKYFQILKAEGQREINLINDLLDLSRLDSGTKSLHLSHVTPETWLPHLVKPFVERAHNQQQQLILDIHPNLPTFVTDIADLERILNELLNNACKYTPPGETIALVARPISPALSTEQWVNGTSDRHSVSEPDLTTSLGRIDASNHSATVYPANGNGFHPGSLQMITRSISIEEADQLNSHHNDGHNGHHNDGHNSHHNDGHNGHHHDGHNSHYNDRHYHSGDNYHGMSSQSAGIQFRITNTGVEIPPNERDRIFDKFYRIPSNDPWKHGGTGLGLALVKELVLRLEGSIEVESQPGQTTFVVQLPLMPQNDHG